VIVADQDDLGAVFVQRVPEGANERQVRIAGVVARGEERMVPVCERAGGLARLEVGAQPLLLLRTQRTRNDRAVGVQDDDMPVAELIAVPPFAARTGGVAEVVEVAGRPGGVVLVIAG
jgi:hypothetical protein